MSSTDWGADRSVLLNLYRSLVRSKLDYGCIVYGSARDSYIKKLDPVHHQGLRLSLGAFRTSPIQSLYVEANEPSLFHRRIKLGLQYATKLKAYPDNPAYNCVFDPAFADSFHRSPKKIASFGLRVRPHLVNAGIVLENIAPVLCPSSPPWMFPRPRLLFDLRDQKKSETCPLLFLQRFGEIRNDYENHSFVYTDGSKTEDRVAAAAVWLQHIASLRLPSASSIFTAEAKAISLALDLISKHHLQKAVICSDSLSCLLAIDSFKVKQPSILQILNQYKRLETTGTEVLFCWIPSHLGIPGNTVVDREAKAALNKPISESKIYYRDLKPKISKYVFYLWQGVWDLEVGNKLHDIHPEIGQNVYSHGMSRKDQVVLARCRMGHSHLTQKFLFDQIKIKPKCEICDCVYDIKHILIDCVDFATIRRQFYTVTSMKDLFDNIVGDVVIKFLKGIGVYHKL